MKIVDIGLNIMIFTLYMLAKIHKKIYLCKHNL